MSLAQRRSAVCLFFWGGGRSVISLNMTAVWCPASLKDGKVLLSALLFVGGKVILTKTRIFGA